jgi:hypothetical protein
MDLDCPAAPGRAEEQEKGRTQVAEVFARFGSTYLRSHVLSPEQGRVVRHIIDCRTPAMGGHMDSCDHCGKSWHSYNSCRDRHCPVCQGAQQMRWIEQRLKRLVPTHHFHVVFTLPAELRPVALANRRLVYDILFGAAKETLLELTQTHWEALPGITAVLHTWTRQMMFHPHLHCIVTGGGLALDDDESWVSSRPRFLFPVKVLSALFRGKFLSRLVEAHEAGELRFVGTSAHLADPDQFAALRRCLYDACWVTYAKRPFGGPQQVIRYLGRYTHRIAISNARLVSINNDAIVFKTHGERTCCLRPDEFLRRFLLHVLPKGFRKIRHSGLFAASNVQTHLAVAKDLVQGMNRRDRRASPTLVTVRPPRPERCPVCGIGRLIRRRLPPARAPPGETTGGFQ